MMKTIRENDIIVYAVNTQSADGTQLDGFTVYLNFSGSVIPVKQYRHNALMFDLLSEGIRLNELRRIKHGRIKGGYANVTRRRKNQSAKLESMVRHLIDVIDCIIEEELLLLPA